MRSRRCRAGSRAGSPLGWVSVPDCEERLVSDLLWVKQIADRAERAWRAGSRDAAREEYRRAHDLLRRAFRTARACSVADPAGVLQRVIDTADRFERVEELIEG